MRHHLPASCNFILARNLNQPCFWNMFWAPETTAVLAEKARHRGHEASKRDKRLS